MPSRGATIVAVGGLLLVAVAHADEPSSGECPQRVHARLPTRYACALNKWPRWSLASLASAAGGYLLWRSEAATPLVGVVRTTEVRIAPEVSAQLVDVKVKKGDRVHAGDVVAELAADELTAAVVQARAALDAASANRDNVYAGVRAEEVAALAAGIAKAKAKLEFAQAQLTRTATLAESNTASQQALDEATNDVASARSDVAEAEANHAEAVAGPTREERAIADAQVKAAASALAVLERHLDKTILRAPADGVVTVIVAEVGENVHAGQPVLAIEKTAKRWLSFNAREDFLHGLTVGAKVDVARAGARDQTPAIVTELIPLGAFATWQAERAVGDHDRATLRLRLDPQGDASAFEPGMTVWIHR
jgi:HlyD family secretion protein